MDGNVIRITKTERGTIKKFVPKKTNKLRKDGEIKQHGGGKQKGQASEVYPLKNKQDIENMKQYFRSCISNAKYDEDKKNATRDLTWFVAGLNLGLRCSDLASLKIGEIYNSDWTFKDGIRRQEKKTSKFKTFFLNQACKDIIDSYRKEYITQYNPNKYLFSSREGGHIEVQTIGKIIKKVGTACGIKQNLSTHSLRKTFGYWFFTAHKDDVNALAHLQRLFNHSSPSITLNYIGIEDEESKEFYNDLNL